MHNYTTASSSSQKKENWLLLNRYRRLHCSLCLCMVSGAVANFTSPGKPHCCNSIRIQLGFFFSCISQCARKLMSVVIFTSYPGDQVSLICIDSPYNYSVLSSYSFLTFLITLCLSEKLSSFYNLYIPLREHFLLTSLSSDCFYIYFSFLLFHLNILFYFLYKNISFNILE